MAASKTPGNVPDKGAAELINELFNHLQPVRERIYSVVAFGPVSHREYCWWWDEANLLFVVLDEGDIDPFQEALAEAMDRIEIDWGMRGGSFSLSSTASMVIPRQVLKERDQWSEYDLSPEWVACIKKNNVLLMGRDIQRDLRMPDTDSLKESLEDAIIPFSFEQTQELRRESEGLNSFLQALDRREEKRMVTDQHIGLPHDWDYTYIRRPPFEDTVRTEIDRYLKRGTISHIYFQAAGMHEGKTWLMRFTADRCRERGIPVRFWPGNVWKGLDTEQQLELVRSKVRPLSSRKWAVFFMDEVDDMQDLNAVMNQIEDQGFVAICSGGLGVRQMASRKNLLRYRLVDFPFRRSQLIGDLRHRFRDAGLAAFASPTLASIVRASENPFKAAAVAAGVLTEAAWRRSRNDPISDAESLTETWIRRVPSREFFEWCWFLADNDDGIEKRRWSLERRANLGVMTR